MHVTRDRQPGPSSGSSGHGQGHVTRDRQLGPSSSSSGEGRSESLSKMSQPQPIQIFDESEAAVISSCVLYDMFPDLKAKQGMFLLDLFDVNEVTELLLDDFKVSTILKRFQTIFLSRMIRRIPINPEMEYVHC